MESLYGPAVVEIDYLSTRRLKQSEHHTQQRGLAAAIGACDCDEIALVYNNIDIIKHITPLESNAYVAH